MANLERRATKLDRVYSVIRKETHRILRLYERSEGKARSTCQAFVDTYDLQRNKLCSITGIS